MAADESIYSVVYLASGSTPTGAQIVAGDDASNNPALHAFNIAYTGAATYDEPAPGWTGASPGTSYKQAWVWHKISTSEYSAVVEATITSAEVGDATLSCSYAIRAAGNALRSGSYAIRGAGNQTLASSYRITAGAHAALASAFVIRAGDSATLPSAYQIRGAGFQALESSYGVLSAGNAQLLGQYAILAGGFAALPGAYAIRAGGFATLSSSYVVEGAGTGATAAQIWSHVLSNGKTAGQTLVEVHAWLSELHLIHGLRPGSPLTVTQDQRTAGAVLQSVSEAAGAVTVQRQ